MKSGIKKGDLVVVITGSDAGKKGKVIELLPKKGKVKVEGARIVTKHVKPRSQGQKGGIMKEEAFMDMSNVMLFNADQNKPVRAGKNRQKK
ncbi:MAG: 50S ribosomal protein L24 [candidate division TM6 bacterium GW2011_GWE2_36_25]|nr:MAG: 50S ribosomal protein L24 [candidate division TM6 bacterium GW2011_GWF2_36_131]KKQ03075.1 MAG: 50S ribosomal protein L24 [candidate division TM6 bacterium GW2011_GWE2_36_25]KKQ18428.1 MAG: 50S ribosomal protein L24 [candidate division TM6 bacterium GW2011_GWA2_36_9]